MDRISGIAYLVDDRRRWTALARLRDTVGLDPDRTLAASDLALADAVTGMRPAQRIARLRRCAELALADAAWSAYPGIGRPALDRLELVTATRAVLALDANALPQTVPARQRAHQLLRRHGQSRCRRSHPTCPQYPLTRDCRSANAPPPAVPAG